MKNNVVKTDLQTSIQQITTNTTTQELANTQSSKPAVTTIPTEQKRKERTSKKLEPLKEAQELNKNAINK